MNSTLYCLNGKGNTHTLTSYPSTLVPELTLGVRYQGGYPLVFLGVTILFGVLQG